jgi:hypothetical protein
MKHHYTRRKKQTRAGRLCVGQFDCSDLGQGRARRGPTRGWGGCRVAGMQGCTQALHDRGQPGRRARSDFLARVCGSSAASAGGVAAPGGSASAVPGAGSTRRWSGARGSEPLGAHGA